jgi:hypothetical protein
MGSKKKRETKKKVMRICVHDLSANIFVQRIWVCARETYSNSYDSAFRTERCTSWTSDMNHTIAQFYMSLTNLWTITEDKPQNISSLFNWLNVVHSLLINFSKKVRIPHHNLRLVGFHSHPKVWASRMVKPSCIFICGAVNNQSTTRKQNAKQSKCNVQSFPIWILLMKWIFVEFFLQFLNTNYGL